MVTKDEDASRVALGWDNHDKSKDLGFKAGLTQHKIGVEEEAQIDLVAEGIAIETGACNNLAFVKTLAFRYKDKRYVIGVE